MKHGENSFRKNYIFNSEEYQEILQLLPVLQKDISSVPDLPDRTRIKLLEKLEDIIIKLDTCMQNLDVFWSFIGRTEIALKVYGQNRVPESIKNFTKTIWKVQCRGEGRPLDAVPPVLF
jgi:hypothetical protein